MICIDIAAGVASILNLTAVSVYRYIEITKPYTYREIVTKGRVITTMLAIWVFAAFMAMVKAVIPRNSDIWYYNPGYQLLVILVCFMLPVFGISYCYFYIFKEVARLQGQLRKDQKQRQKNKFAVEIKAIKTIAIVVVMFSVCWCPFFVVIVVNGFCKCVKNKQLITFVKIMHYSNSALNPIIYVWYNKQYRKGLLTALAKCAYNNGADSIVPFLKRKTNAGTQEETEMV